MLLLLLVLVDVAVFNNNASVVVQYENSKKSKIFFDVVTTVAAPIVAQFEFSFATTISICDLICVALAIMSFICRCNVFIIVKWDSSSPDERLQ
jgi:hypothetical protein